MSEANSPKQLLAALGRIPSGLFVVTARRGAAETGMLASWVQQCSFEPPMISLAIKRPRDITVWLTEGSPFTLNILDASQTDMIVHFGRGFPLDDQAFDGLDVLRPDDSTTVLGEALAYLHCLVSARMPAGDHDLFLGHVQAGRVLNEGHPMIHIRKSGAHY